MIWSHTIGGGLLDEPGKPGRRDYCLLRLVANRTALRRLCILARRKNRLCFTFNVHKLQFQVVLNKYNLYYPPSILYYLNFLYSKLGDKHSLNYSVFL